MPGPKRGTNLGVVRNPRGNPESLAGCWARASGAAARKKRMESWFADQNRKFLARCAEIKARKE